MKRTIQLLILTIGITFQAQSQDEKTTFSVAEAEEYALAHNEKIKNADLDILSADKKIWETIAIGLPQVNIEGQFQQLLDILNRKKSFLK